MGDIEEPILIVGAPRSGTSLLQKILRNHPDLWSLPSESDMIWDLVCHPKFNHWDSECLTEHDVTQEKKLLLLKKFNSYVCPSSFWKGLEKTDVIWGFNRYRITRRLLKPIYKVLFPMFQNITWGRSGRRIIEKTASNAFRMGFVNEIFPDAKIIYLTRDGRNTINSLINSWRNPTRFFTYAVPEKLEIEGYEQSKWKFVLPPGWRNYIYSPLEEVCAFQWVSCHEHLMKELSKDKYSDRVLQIKLEDFVDSPEEWLRKISKFCNLSYAHYFEKIAKDIPVVNSPDGITSHEKWQQQNKELVGNILGKIEPTMVRLGYLKT